MPTNLHRTSTFGIKIDLAQSQGAYLYDMNSRRSVLDLFGMYSSLPLGYSHPALTSPEFDHAVLEYASVKLPNCEMDSPAAERFLAAFMGHPSMALFSRIHLASTGALAVEAAVKAATLATRLVGERSRVATLRGSFHGINGYGGLLAAPDGPAAGRLDGFLAGSLALPFDDPVAMMPRDSRTADRVLAELGLAMLREPIAAVLIEPIQCTSGDRPIDRQFLRDLRELCTASGVPLIFDEIQTGFGGTGAMWFFEQLGVVPDILVFGKKAQVSGILVREPFARIFDRSDALEVTWDGDAIDMIRCTAILGAFATDRIVETVCARASRIWHGLDTLGLSWRAAGLLIAIDFDQKADRDEFVARMWHDEATIMIPTGDRTVRWRPHLAIDEAAIDQILWRTECALNPVPTGFRP